MFNHPDFRYVLHCLIWDKTFAPTLHPEPLETTVTFRGFFLFLQPPPHYVSFVDFFANGFVLIVTMFVVLSVRVTILNAYFKLAFTLSAEVRAAIQVNC